MFRTALISMFLTSTAFATTWIVDDDGKADFDNIYLAVAAASDGDVILVMEGTYYSSYINPHNKAILVEGEINSKGELLVTVDGMQSGAIIECYSGEGPDTVFRNLILTNGSSYYGGGMTLFDGSSPTVENCIFRNNTGTIEGGGIHLRENCNPIIINCRFEDNLASGPGGGMFCIENSNPTLLDCTFENNTAYNGGGMYNNESSPTVTDCTFTDNYAEFNGGGMYNYESSPSLTDCTFTGNTAIVAGGMINAYNSSPALDGCTFTGNASNNGNGSDDGHSGGMFNWKNSSPTLTNCIFENNTAYSIGGGMLNNDNSSPTLTNCIFENNVAGDRGGGLSNSWYSNTTIENCTFTGNTAKNGGGGMWNESASVTLNGCTFTDNTANYGGGMYNRQSDPTLENCTLNDCTFTDNTANYGAGMYNIQSAPTLENCTFTGNTATNYGCGMSNYNSDPTLTNCTFTGNTAAEGGGGMSNFQSDPTLENCIFTGNTADDFGGGMYNEVESYPTLENCTFENNTADYGGGMCNYIISSPTIENCTFRNNTASWGGGMYNYGSDPTITDCLFVSNKALAVNGGFGGAIFCQAYEGEELSDITLTNCTFSVNVAQNSGGAVYCGLGNFNFEDCEFAGNIAEYGGALHINGGITELTNCSVTNNTATVFGGGLQVLLGDVTIRDTFVCSNFPDQITGTFIDDGGNTINSTCIPGNQVWTVDDDGEADFAYIQHAIDAADHGDEIIVYPGTYVAEFKDDQNVVNTLGKYITLHSSDGPEVTIIQGDSLHRGIFCPSGGTTVIDGFTIQGGHAQLRQLGEKYILGGGILIDNASPIISNCIIKDNYAFDFIYSGAFGAGLFGNDSTATLINCTFNHNICLHGGGGVFMFYGNITMENCVISDSSASFGAGVSMQGGEHSIINCTITENNASDVGGGIFVEASTTPPTLIDTTVCNNSPEQIVGLVFDGGGNIIEDECPPDCPADINGDGTVEVNDLIALIAAWACLECPAEDIDGDGIVGVNDFILLISNWGECE